MKANVMVAGLAIGTAVSVIGEAQAACVNNLALIGEMELSPTVTEYDVRVDDVQNMTLLQAPSADWDVSGIVQDDNDPQTTWLTGNAYYDGILFHLKIERGGAPLVELTVSTVDQSVAIIVEDDVLLQGAEHELLAARYSFDDFFNDAQSQAAASSIESFIVAEGCDTGN